MKDSPDEVRKLIEKYLFKKIKIIDLSTDTWFNQYLIRIPYSVFTTVSNAISGAGGKKDDDE